MKLSLKKPQKLRKKHVLAISLGSLMIVGISSFVLFKTQIARSAIASDSQFRFVMPYFGGSSQGTKTYLEVAQTGEGNTLDAGESWSKFYFDEGRVRQGTVGVFRGGYGGEVDSLGTVGGNAGQRFSDPDAVRYDFYLARSTAFEGPDGVVVSEETPCRLAGQLTPSLTVYSGDMSVDGWYKIAADRFLDNATCGSGANGKWDKTTKTGKYVLFMRVTWATSAPSSSGQKQGRVNAYKAGAAYADSTEPLDNPITGYWSDFISAQQAGTPQRAAYSVQDRVSANNTNGSYTFQFAPDCRIPRGGRETRYLHWKDVDYPAYYRAPWPVQPPPEFDLVEITPAGSRSTVLHVDESNGKYNGSQQNVHGSIAYEFKGGHKYEWVWNNVARVDGISFWIPYDDYSSLAGCGSYKQSIGLQGGTGSGWTDKDFEVAGGDTVTFALNEKYDSGSSAAPTTTSNATLTSQGGAQFSNTFEGDGPTSISDEGYKEGGSRVRIQWKLPGMGPADPYISSRRLTFSYKVKDDAQNGARHCFNSNLTPISNTNPLDAANSNQICITVNNSLKPFVSTSGADVHAGDCTLLDGGKFKGTDGKIIGVVTPSGSKGSSGSYIVSAGDAITSFGSGGAPNGGALTFGKGGKYGAVCRPTIDAISTYFQKDTAAVWPTPAEGTALDLNALPAGGRYKVIFPSGGRVTGQSRATVTLYAANGTITVDGPPNSTVGSNMGQAAARDKLPVVGMIARDIKINPNVTTVNAVMYATYDFDTCAVSNWTTQCKSLLTIKGFAMARTFSFKRVSASANGLQKGEQIDFNAAFYLNPPPGFGDQSKLMKYLGERAPLY